MFRRLASITLLAVLGTAAPGLAAPILDFQGNNGGNVTFAGGVWAGSGININLLTFTPDDANPAVFSQYAVQNGSLSFSTATGQIAVVGGISALGLSNGTTLLNGTIFSATPNFNTNHSSVALVIAGTDTKNPALLTALGLTNNYQFALFGSTIAADTTSPFTGPWNARSTDITNTGVPIPEAATMMLLGSGLIGVGASIRRRMRRAA